MRYIIDYDQINVYNLTNRLIFSRKGVNNKMSRPEQLARSMVDAKEFNIPQGMEKARAFLCTPQPPRPPTPVPCHPPMPCNCRPRSK